MTSDSQDASSLAELQRERAELIANIAAIDRVLALIRVLKPIEDSLG